MILAHTELSEEAKARLQAMQQAIANCRIEGTGLPRDDSAYLEELIADDSVTVDQRSERTFAHVVGNPLDARQSHAARSRKDYCGIVLLGRRHGRKRSAQKQIGSSLQH